MEDLTHFGEQLRARRQRRHLSQRALAQAAGLAVSFIAKVEAGQASPTLATLMKLAEALGLTVVELLSPPAPPPETITIVPTAQMQCVDDGDKRWRFLFPNHPSIHVVMTDELYQPQTRHIELEQHPHDICGVVLSGELTLEAPPAPPRQAQSGEAFYIKAGTPHRSWNATDAPLHLISVELLKTELPG
jgi:transcriptional regulator with XRE-family HTH domain